MISEVRNIDCMVAMKEFPDKFFELAIVDPPYFSGPEKRKYYGKEISSHGVRRINYKPLTNSWDRPDVNYFNELARVSKNQIIWGINYFEFLPKTSGRIIWDKVNGENDFSDCEIASNSLIDSVRIFRYMWSGMMQGRGDGTDMTMQGNKNLNEKKIHPTQKPIALYKWCLKKYAKEGDKILDTHGGSMSSMIACLEMGFEIKCFEKDTEYYNLAKLRIQRHLQQLNAFNKYHEVKFYDNLGIPELRDKH